MSKNRLMLAAALLLLPSAAWSQGHQPSSSRASNLGHGDSRSVISPSLPDPNVGENASVTDLLQAAQRALAAGRTGETQQTLEMAQTRLLDRSVTMGQTRNPSDNPAVVNISRALQALATGDRANCMQIIQATIPITQAAGN